MLLIHTGSMAEAEADVAQLEINALNPLFPRLHHVSILLPMAAAAQFIRLTDPLSHPLVLLPRMAQPILLLLLQAWALAFEPLIGMMPQVRNHQIKLRVESPLQTLKAMQALLAIPLLSPRLLTSGPKYHPILEVP